MLPKRLVALVALAALGEVLLQAPGVISVHAQAQPPAASSARSTESSSAVSQTGVERSSLEEPVEEPRRHSALLITGVCTLISSYLVTAFFGLLIHVLFGYDCEHESSRPCSQANALFIPLIGPLFPSESYPLGMRAFFAGTQALGLVLTVVGAFVNSNSPTRSSTYLQPSRARLRVSVAPGTTGALVSATLSF